MCVCVFVCLCGCTSAGLRGCGASGAVHAGVRPACGSGTVGAAFGTLFFLGVFFTGSGVILAELGLSSLMNRLFLRVTRLEPSTLTRTWECGLFSSTTPDLSHFVGLLPVWFWINTGVPTSNISKFFVFRI